MFNVYALRLKHDKFYTGSTKKNVLERFEEHINGSGSEWTNLYEPLEILEVIENADSFDEDKLTKKYMSLYGLENVRGGSYTSLILPYFQLKALQMELSTSGNRCFKCHQVGHYVNDCCQSKITNNYTNKCSLCKATNHNVNNCPSKEFLRKQGYRVDKYYFSNSSNKCWRCGRTGHWANECYAYKNINGEKIW